tara:strand:- start:114 stop:650 length:537 start_codon:yes stop_codon:yes gene_type:complete
MKDCCTHNKTAKKCIRKSDKKEFSLPRRFTRKRCQKGVQGFTMKSSCAPYNDCLDGGKAEKQFLYNPDDPKKSFDVYIDKDPSDTIPIKYTTVSDVKTTIKTLEKLYKQNKYPHKRIWQVGMIMKVRLEAMLKHKNELYPNAKNVKKRFNLANKYFLFLRSRTKEKNEKKRKEMKFNI